MINTIFYFVDNMSPELYAEMIEDNSLSSRTLVFAKNQKSIYMGGKSFGKMDQEDLVLMIHDAVEAGLLEVIRGERGYKGDKGDKGDKGEKGDTVINPYDDSEIRQRILEITEDLIEIQNKEDQIGMTAEQLQRLSELENNATLLQQTVDNIEVKTEQDVNNLIDNAIDTSQDLLNKIKEHGTDNMFQKEGWNDKLNTWASTYAVATETDGNGQQVNVKLSDLKLRQDSISQRVQSLQVFVDEHETPVSMEALDALIDQTVDTNESITTIKNTYAFKNDDKVEWMVSGFESAAQNGGSFALMYATDKSNINGNISSATAAVKTAVQTDENGIVSSAMGQILASATNNDITSISGLLTKVDEKASVADMVASINDGQSQAHAAVLATADSSFTANIASYANDIDTALSDIENIKGDIQTANINISSVTNKANATEASLTTLTEAGGRIAQVESKANNTEAAISSLVDSSTKKVTARTIKNSLASDDGVWNEMKTAFATTVDGTSIVSSAKSSIAQDFNQASWEDYLAYMNGVAGNASTAITDTKAYVDGKKALINDFATFIGNDGVSATSIASKLANSTEAVTALSTKFVTPSALSTATSDLVLKSTYDSAITGLLSSINGKANDSDVYKKSEVYTKSDVDGIQSGLQSSITTLDGQVVKQASVIASINNSGESNVKINADKIKIGDINISAGQVSGITDLITDTVTADYIQTRLSGLNDLLTDSSVNIDNQSVKISDSNRYGFLGSVFDTLELTDDDITSKHVVVSGNGVDRTNTIRWKLDGDGNVRVSGNLIVGGKLYYDTSDITKDPDGVYVDAAFDGTEVLEVSLSAVADAISDLQDEIANIKTRLQALES